MLHFLHTHWLWLFGAVSFGIAAGWVTYFLVAALWTFRPVQLLIGVLAIGIVLAVAKLVPARYGFKLEVGLYLAILGAIGGFVGWALRDIAEFAPTASNAGLTASGTPGGSYLFRDARAGTGAESAYMRTTGEGAPARARLPLSPAALIQAPASGGYTFPDVRPAEAPPTIQRAASATGLRRHWTWPAG